MDLCHDNSRVIHFHTLCFPHEGKIAMIDQLSFTHTSPNAPVGPSVPVIDNSQQATEDVGVKCIPLSWVALISWHQFITFIPFPMSFHRR
jgi:hypothetical protein